MGQYMSSPVTEKHSEDGGGNGVEYGASAMQGWRLSMEDAHIALPNLEDGRAIFGVFDGHGGSEVALFCKKHLPEELLALKDYKDKNYEAALTTVFHRMDEMIADTSYAEELEMLKNERNNTATDQTKSSSTSEDPSEESAGSNEASDTKDGGAGSDTDNGAADVEISTEGHEPDGDGESQTVRLQFPGSMQALSFLQKLQEGKVNIASGGADANGSPLPATGDPIMLPYGGGNGNNSASRGNGTEEGDGQGEETGATNFRNLIPLNFMDEQQCRLPDHRVTAGCTAVVAIIADGEVIVANAGDSKAILCRGGTAVGLSFEHKPFNDIERRRIEAAGGFVSAQGRVNNNLNLSRSIGDLKYKGNTSIPAKEQMITAEPDTMREKLQPEDEFMLIACDGVWDVMGNQEAMDFVRSRISTPGKKLSEICEEIFAACLSHDPKRTSGLGGDNMTAVLVRFTEACKRP